LTPAGTSTTREPRPDRRRGLGATVPAVALLGLASVLVSASRVGAETPAPGGGAVAAPTGAGSEAKQSGSAPTAIIERFHAAILTVLREAEALGYEGRFRRLAPAVEEAFDLPYMAEKVVGGRWKRLSESERQRWLTTFGHFMKANYAGRFVGYSGQSFETLGREPGAHGTAVVRTRLHNPSGEDVDLTYRLRSIAPGWRIIDIYLKGTVSELALRRSEYAAVLQREGFDTLLRVVEGRIAELSSGKE
jgi:phospholipid transport system substrate-binding protein